MWLHGSIVIALWQADDDDRLSTSGYRHRSFVLQMLGVGARGGF
jgi:hypothetical protein